ncbi:MAG: penicillin-binding protein 2 [Sphingopyxis sp.]|nr:penicillin-binding protein 2 [Sphingopyxis sp.]
MNSIVIRPVRVRTAGIRQKHLVTAQQRLMVLMLMFGAIMLLIAARLMFVGLFDGPARGVGGLHAGIPARGDIVDRNGMPLARTINAYAIRVDPAKLLNDPDFLAAELVRIFPDMTYASVRAKLTGGKSTYIRRRALPEQVKAVNAIGEIGFDYPREQDRLYPQLSLASHILGFTNADGRGVMGIEGAFDERLSDAAQRGEPLALSIDARVQAVLESELGSAVTNLEAVGGAGVILDANSGEVLAMASLPTFNSNKVGESALGARRNAMTHNLYELGSTFKPITVAAAIDAGTVTSMARRYDATKPVSIAGHQINDVHSQKRWLNVPETLIHSSNITTALIADELGAERMQRVFKQLEFRNRPHIEIKERAKPIWPKSWGRLTNMTVGFGHGIAVTPLHLASAYAALVNGGVWRPATLLRRDGALPKGRQVFKPSTSARMRQLLRMIVVDGTGKQADAPGFRVGGKTGSAEMPGVGGYNRSSVVATFAAAFPMDNPRYVVVAMIDRPKGNAYSSGQRTAGWTAAPVVRKVVMRAGPMLGVIPDASRDVDVSDLTPLLWKNRAEEQE